VPNRLGPFALGFDHQTRDHRSWPPMILCTIFHLCSYK
jgi:hypothetical protein